MLQDILPHNLFAIGGHMHTSLRTVLGSFFALLLLSAPAFAADTIKIGVAGAHSGENASYGTPALEAARIVVDKYNKAGGLLGKKIELLVQDDQCKPELATNAATKLIADGAVAVLGHTCSGPTEAALPLYEEAKILLISPSATAPSLTQGGKHPIFFRTIGSDDAQARLGADFIQNILQAKKVAILHDKGAYGKGYAEFVKQFLEEGGKTQVVLFDGITTGAVDYSAAVLKINSSGADAVAFGGYQPEAAKIVSQMRKKRMNTAFVSEDGVKVENFIKLAGKSAEGVFASGPKDLTALPATREALDAYRAAYKKEPAQYYLETYSALEALFAAITKTGGTDSLKLAEAMRDNSVPTVLGSLRFDKKGDAEGIGMSMYEVKGGKFVEVK